MWFSGSDARRLLDAFFASGSHPQIDGYFVPTSAYEVCLGVVTRGWQGVVPSPTEESAGIYGEAFPAAYPPGWWGWRLCGRETANWRWDRWLWFGTAADYGGVDAMRGLLSEWTETQPWDGTPGAWDGLAQPIYYAVTETTGERRTL